MTPYQDFAAKFPSTSRRTPQDAPGISSVLFSNPDAGINAAPGSFVDTADLMKPAVVNSDGSAAAAQYQPAGSFIAPGTANATTPPPDPGFTPGISAVIPRGNPRPSTVSETGSSFSGSAADAAALSMGTGGISEVLRAGGGRGGRSAGGRMTGVDPTARTALDVTQYRQAFDAESSYRQNIAPNLSAPGTQPDIAANRMHYLDTLALKASGITPARATSPAAIERGPDGSVTMRQTTAPGMTAADQNRRATEQLAASIVQQQQDALQPRLVNLGTDSLGRPVEGTQDRNGNFSRIAPPAAKPAVGQEGFETLDVPGVGKIVVDKKTRAPIDAGKVIKPKGTGKIDPMLVGTLNEQIQKLEAEKLQHQQAIAMGDNRFGFINSSNRGERVSAIDARLAGLRATLAAGGVDGGDETAAPAAAAPKVAPAKDGKKPTAATPAPIYQHTDVQAELRRRGLIK